MVYSKKVGGLPMFHFRRALNVAIGERRSLPDTCNPGIDCRKVSDMAIRSEELHQNLQHLNGMLTTHEAAKQLDLSYWHFMHLVEAGRIPGVRVVDRWLFSPDDLDNYRRSKYGKLEDMASTALNNPAVNLTERQATICKYLVSNERPSEIARKLQQSRQAIHSQIALIKEKVSRLQRAQNEVLAPEATPRRTRTKRSTSLPA
jgi:excisionase family DNA binding protein